MSVKRIVDLVALCAVVFLILALLIIYDAREWDYRLIGSIILLIGTVVAVIATVRLRAYILRQMAMDRRHKEMLEWARSCGYTYSATEALMKFRCEPFVCLQRGKCGYPYNVVEGASGNRAFRAFDYYCHSYYERWSSDSEVRPVIAWLIGVGKGDRHFSAVVIEAGIPLLPLTIRPRDMLDEVTGFIGFEEIGFESAEFSQKFFVKSADRRWAYDVLPQKIMEVLLANPYFLIDFQGSQIIAYRNRMFPTKDFESALRVVAAIADCLPQSAARCVKAVDTGGKTL